MEKDSFDDDWGSPPDFRNQPGVPWVWFGVGVGTTLVFGAAVVFVVYEMFLRAPGPGAAGDAGAAAPASAAGLPNQTGTTAPRPAGATIAASEKAPGGSASAPFSGKWFVNYACREGSSRPSPVGFGVMALDQTSPTAATVTFHNTAQQSPGKGQARIAGDQLSFQWTVSGQSRNSSLSGRLIDPETLTGTMIEAHSPTDWNCNFAAQKETGGKMTKPPMMAEPPP
jgi:hypothetical protein